MYYGCTPWLPDYCHDCVIIVCDCCFCVICPLHLLSSSGIIKQWMNSRFAASCLGISVPGCYLLFVCPGFGSSSFNFCSCDGFDRPAWDWAEPLWEDLNLCSCSRVQVQLCTQGNARGNTYLFYLKIESPVTQIDFSRRGIPPI